MKKIYLIRHGQTDYNKKGIVQGSGIDAPLNEEGIRQARAFYENYRHISFDKVYISSLKRTRQSVQSFIDAGIPYYQLPGLNEINWGTAEGTLFASENAHIYEDLINSWQTGSVDLKVPGGESPVDVMIRQKEAFEYILSQKNEKTVLVCMHGRAMRVLLCWMQGRPLSCMDDYRHDNLSLYILNYTNGSYTIELQNDIAHLETV